MFANLYHAATPKEVRFMSGIPEDQKQQIIAGLDKAGATLPCPRCGHGQFSLVDGYFNHPIQTSLGGLGT
jgi:hypothetical protein